MPLIAKSSPSTDFEPVPAGTHLGVCYQVIDLGTQHEQTPDGEKDLHKIMLVWELPEEKYVKDGKENPMSISREYTLSLGEKANLYKDLIGWRGKVFTPQELEGFDIANVAGKACTLSVIHKVSGKGKKYASITGVGQLMKGMKAPTPINKLVVYDVATGRNETFKALPEWIQRKIGACLEWNADSQTTSTVEPVTEPETDEVPF